MALTPEQEAQKRAIFDRMSERRRKYVLKKFGYDEWDPFAPPKDPIDIRTGPSKRTAQQLVNEFLRSRRGKPVNDSYTGAVLYLALGLTNDDERCQGMYDFSVWYHELLRREGRLDPPAGQDAPDAPNNPPKKP